MFQSLSREKPFCHHPNATLEAYREDVSIAQSRKALLPPSDQFGVFMARAMFQSLSREKPFCHAEQAADATSEGASFQSLSREKPFCHI